jgi:hypothetical protein
LSVVSIADVPQLMTREAESAVSGEVLLLPLSTLFVASIVSSSMWWGIINLARWMFRVL